MSTGGVAVVGGINQDVTVHAGHRPRDGETVVGDGPRWSSGGKGANMAVAAARAGAAVTLCGAVGDDAAGRAQVAELEAAGVGVAHVGRRPDVATGVALIVVTPDGENSIVVGAGANATLEETEVRRAVAGHAVVLAQTEVGAGPADAAAVQVAEDSTRLVLSLAPVVAVAPATLAAADPLVVNEEEAADLGAGDAEQLRTRTGARAVVLTLGARGAVVADADGITAVPSPVVDPVDTTGAGDVLAGVLAAALADGDDLRAATARACAAAAEAVTRPGAR